MENAENELLCMIWLTQIFGAGNPAVNAVVKKYGSARAAHDALYDFSSDEFASLAEKYRENVKKYNFASAEKVLEQCAVSGIEAIVRGSEAYPQALDEIDNPPAVLYCKGDVSSINDSVNVAVVGTRQPTEYSRKAASALVRGMAECGIDIVSGFAVGIDIVAHAAAVSCGRKTYAVLGCGINYDYPKENARFRGRIIENGAFISEYPPETRPSSFTFPPRNRILAGLSAGTAVIEAGKKSGSLITANHANEQGKVIFAVPPADIFSSAYAGNVSLLRDGAVPVMSVRDILYELYPRCGEKLSERAKELWENGSGGTVDVYKNRRKATDERPPVPQSRSRKSRIRNRSVGNPAPEAKRPVSVDISSLPEEQKRIAELLRNAGKPIIADEISAGVGTDISRVLELLTEMELDGTIACGTGNTYYIADT